jgi:hypothetical protein
LEKTVQVVDEVGNRYEATFPKRAKGLVKNGRARFIDENTICLARPPKNILNSEDMNMTTNTENKANEIKTEATESKYTLAYALEQIEKIANSTKEISQALAAIANMDSEPTMNGGSADAMAKAAADVIRCRETTNQKLIEFYSKMVDDLKPKNEKDKASRDEFMGWVRDCIGSAEAGMELPDFAKLWKSINS